MNHLIVIENEVEIERKTFPGINIKWLGDNGIVRIDASATFMNCHFQIGSDSTISVGKRSIINNLFIRCASMKSRVVLGTHFICNGGEFILARGMNSQEIVIGNNCLFSNSIAFFTSDGHSLIDTNTNEVINRKGGHIYIGNHCWIGHNVKFLKNASIADDVVVGSCSLVTKKFVTSHCVIAGQPAQIVKENISWDISSPDEYSQRSQQNGN